MAKNLPVKEMKVLTVQGAESTLDDNNHAVSFEDKEDPFSLYNITNSGHIKATLDDAKAQEMLLTEEGALRRQIKPTSTINKLRIAFWMEYDRAINQKCKMNLTNVYRGICFYEYFVRIFRDAKFLHNAVWILKPRQNYSMVMNEALDMANHRLREIIEMPIYDQIDVVDSQGKKRKKRVPNTKTAELILKAQKVLDERVKGGTVYKAAQPTTSVNVNVNNTKNDEGVVEVKGAEIVDAKTVEEQIALLEADSLTRSNVEVKEGNESTEDGTIEAESRVSKETPSGERT